LAVEDAVKASFEIRQILRRYAESLPPDRQHFKVRLNGVGVHCDHDVIVDKDGKLHGAVPNEAYHIGEDVYANGNVLVTEDVFKQVRMLKRSGVDLTCYCASRGTNGAGGTQRLQKAF